MVLFNSPLSSIVLGKKFIVYPTPFSLNSFSANYKLYFQMYKLSFLSLSNADSIF
jgi:hypothetical protein